jgi:hypothetical protein
LATGARDPLIPVTGGVKAVVYADKGIGFRPIVKLSLIVRIGSDYKY